MPSGKSTENTLAHRLEALVPPADSSFDKGATWEKLQQRLGDKKQKAFSLYTWWSAAAILLILTCLYLMMPFTKQRADGFISIKKMNPGIPVIRAEISPANTSAANTVTSNAAGMHTKELPLQKSSPGTPDTVQSIVHVPVIIPDKQTVIKDTAIAIRQVPALIKKKLPLVYNNEIVRTDAADAPPPGGTSTTITIPGLKKDNAETFHKAETNDADPGILKNRWLPFNKSAKPKE